MGRSFLKPFVWMLKFRIGEFKKKRSKNVSNCSLFSRITIQWLQSVFRLQFVEISVSVFSFRFQILIKSVNKFNTLLLITISYCFASSSIGWNFSFASFFIGSGTVFWISLISCNLWFECLPSISLLFLVSSSYDTVIVFNFSETSETFLLGSKWPPDNWVSHTIY